MGIILYWLGIHSVLLYDICLRTQQFGGDHTFKRDIRHCLQLICLATVGIIWVEDNSRIFHNKEFPLAQLIDMIKIHS